MKIETCVSYSTLQFKHQHKKVQWFHGLVTAEKSKHRAISN